MQINLHNYTTDNAYTYIVIYYILFCVIDSLCRMVNVVYLSMQYLYRMPKFMCQLEEL